MNAYWLHMMRISLKKGTNKHKLRLHNIPLHSASENSQQNLELSLSSSLAEGTWSHGRNISKFCLQKHALMQTFYHAFKGQTWTTHVQSFTERKVLALLSSIGIPEPKVDKMDTFHNYWSPVQIQFFIFMRLVN